MSAKLVRKLLQETAPAGISASPVSEEQENKNRKRKRKRQEESKTVGEDDVLDLRIQSLLALDKKPTSNRNPGKGRASSRLLERKEKEEEIEAKRRRKLTGTIVGNSRSSSGRPKIERHQRTVVKKVFVKEQKEKALQSIAKILKKNSKKQKK